MSLYICKDIQGAKLLKQEGRRINIIEQINKSIKNIGILNLMPNKIETEVHILRLLEATNENLNIKFIRLRSHKSKNTSYKYLKDNYYLFEEIKKDLDAIVITGAPIEKLDFGDVTYIKELRDIFDYSKDNFKSSVYICWAAQAGLNHLYGIRKTVLHQKIFGVYNHKILKDDDIFKDINQGFKSPHSRYTSLVKEDIKRCKDIKVLCSTDYEEDHIIKGKFNDYYILGHCEYDKYCLKKEYLRDINLKLEMKVPKNYFENNNPNKDIIANWEDSSIRLYKNWINIF
jgi:homoserine O-succinyltransferase